MMSSPATALNVTESIMIPLSEFEFTYSRSSGPGGQNVNKVSSRVQLRWPLEASPSLSDEVKTRLRSLSRRRITNDGDLLMTSQRYRDQVRNRDDCLEKLAELIREAAKRPVPRRPTKVSRGSKERRLKEKRVRAQRKEQRRLPGRDE